MRIRNILPSIGIIIFIYIIYNIGYEKIVHLFLLISPIYLFIALLFIAPRIILSSYKWLIICKKQKMNFHLFYIIKIFLISMFYGTVTPASLGGFISVYYIKNKDKVTWEKSITNYLLDASTEFIAGLFLALIGSIILIEYYPGIFPTILFVFVLTFGLFIILIKKEKGEILIKVLIRWVIPKKLKLKVDESIEAFYEDIPRLRDLIIPIFLENVVWIIIGVQVYIIALGIGVPISIPMYQFICIYMISFIAGILPISIGGLGVREGTLVLLLSKFDVDPEVSFVISLVGYILTNIIPGMLGWFLSINLKPNTENLISN
ncbi:MAG: flippase-like domain-containing protein [Candidatus Thermoplasmatota archaeon]|nr:flippase-like domain-containing protein [Candidatus Thermoplasmatota archaeon]